MIRRRRNRAVSLLLEIIVGLGVFSTALLFVFSIFPLAQRSAIQARNVSIATGLAHDRLEQLRNEGFAGPDLGIGTVNPDAGSPVLVPVTVNGVSTTLPFTRVYKVAYIDSPANTLKSVVVNVSWTDSETQAGSPFIHTIQMEGYVGQY